MSYYPHPILPSLGVGGHFLCLPHLSIINNLTVLIFYPVTFCLWANLMKCGSFSQTLLLTANSRGFLDCFCVRFGVRTTMYIFRVQKQGVFKFSCLTVKRTFSLIAICPAKLSVIVTYSLARWHKHTMTRKRMISLHTFRRLANRSMRPKLGHSHDSEAAESFNVCKVRSEAILRLETVIDWLSEK